MQYPAEVGVNTYIKVQLSFLDKSVSSRDVFLYLRLTVNCVNSVCLTWYLVSEICAVLLLQVLK